jgi:DNA-binding transcriptional MocR family regulator
VKGGFVFTIDRASAVPLTEQVCDGLAGLIGTKFGERDRLPSVRQLAQKLGVSAWTVSEAYERLVALGLIASRPGAGYFVARPTPAARPQPPLPRAHIYPVNAVSYVRNAVDSTSHAIPAGSGFFPRAWMEGALPAAAIGRLLRGDPMLAMPAPAQGLLDLRRQLTVKLSVAGITAVPEQIVTTFGVTHAVQLICKQMLKPGDSVVIEDPSYMVQQSQLLDFGAQLLAVPRRHDGPDLQQLEQLVQQYRPRLVFTQTALHNPTGGTSSPSNCYGLLSLAEKYNFHVVEDDVFGDLAPDSTLRLASLDTFRRVFYVSSFTKVLSPAVRTGFVVGPLDQVDGLIEHKILGVLTGSSLQEALVAHVLKTGGYGAHVNSLRRRLAKAHSSALRLLTQAGVAFDQWAMDGLFLWGAMPQHVVVERMLKEAFHEGILLSKGSIFSPTGGFEHHFRFNVAHCGDPRLLEFLSRFAAAPPARG